MPRLGCYLEPGRSLDEGVHRVRTAESLGYDSVWVTHIAAREPLQVLGLYAHHTERIALGTAVVPIALRHPALLAMEAATLDEISGHRLRLGIGISHRVTMEGWYGLSIDEPVSRMEEYARIVRGVLDDGGVGLEGRHYTARFSFMGYRPPHGVPLLFAALGPRMLRLAAALADGVVLWMCSPRYIREAVRPVLEEALRERGRSIEGFDIVAAVPCSIDEDRAAGADAFRRRALPYLQLPFYRKTIAAAGHADVLRRVDEALASGGPPEASAAIPDAFVEEYAGVGGIEASRATLDAYREAGATVPCVSPLRAGAAEVTETLRALAPEGAGDE